MLKIKDDVDYNILKKWFIRKRTYGEYYYKPRDNKAKLLINVFGIIFICQDIKHIPFNNTTLDLLYDLIKADLVEKVEV